MGGRGNSSSTGKKELESLIKRYISEGETLDGAKFLANRTIEAKKSFNKTYDPNKQQREITSETYKRAQNRLDKEVAAFVGTRRR